MRTSKLVVLGVDAADARLVRRWAGEGYLPTFARLLASGFVAPIATPVGVLEGGVWPTFLTSSLPATHGMISFQSMKLGTYDIENGMYADRLPRPPFWAEMSRAGKRLAVVDAPFARPDEGLNGIQITNWGVHDFWSWRRSSAPRELIDEVVRRFGDHPVHHCDGENRSPADYEVLRLRLIAGAQRKAELLRYVLAKEDWDFFLGVFSESHCAGHQFWHFSDPSHPRHDTSASPTLRSAIRDVYCAIDAGVGAVLQDLDPGVPVLVMLSHGMGPYYSGSHLLDAVLDRLGMGGRADAPGFPGIDSYQIRGIHGEFWKLRRLLPRSVRRAMKALLPGSMGTLWGFAHPVPSLWKPGMRAIAIPSNNMTSAIRINLKGREPFGAVEPGEEYEALCRELTARLVELRNPDTGRPAVQWVQRMKDLYRGPRLEHLPDLFVEWDHSAPITALESPAIGRVTGALVSERTGDHWQQGLLLGRGPHFRRGEIRGLCTQDVAPTLLDFLEVPIPSSYEGRTVASALLRA